MNFLSLTVRYATILAAFIGVVAVFFVNRTQAEKQVQRVVSPPYPPPAKPSADSVAATGIIEAASDNVSIGTPIPGLVTSVSVAVNNTVKQGDILMSLDSTELTADALSLNADIEDAQANIAVREAELKKTEARLQRLEAVKDTRVLSAEELDDRRLDTAVARSMVNVTKSQLAIAQSQAARNAALIERLNIRAPRDGQILQINVRAGEYASNQFGDPIMILGDTSTLQIRVDVDEQNATRIRNGQKAFGYLKGDPTVTFPLTFVRIEPYVIPKVSLTGVSSERVDTRVLQVIYSLKREENAPLFVGQQVDVFIETGLTNESR